MAVIGSRLGNSSTYLELKVRTSWTLFHNFFNLHCNTSHNRLIVLGFITNSGCHGRSEKKTCMAGYETKPSSNANDCFGCHSLL